ncbi:hypothetical protein HK102_006377 [Quaeritorhiza haematococci]|nr:hypothetical protein HK102_006377 [Quaeritorhiza haematococci]
MNRLNFFRGRRRGDETSTGGSSSAVGPGGVGRGEGAGGGIGGNISADPFSSAAGPDWNPDIQPLLIVSDYKKLHTNNNTANGSNNGPNSNYPQKIIRPVKVNIPNGKPVLGRFVTRAVRKDIGDAKAHLNSSSRFFSAQRSAISPIELALMSASADPTVPAADVIPPEHLYIWRWRKEAGVLRESAGSDSEDPQDDKEEEEEEEEEEVSDGEGVEQEEVHVDEQQMFNSPVTSPSAEESGQLLEAQQSLSPTTQQPPRGGRVPPSPRPSVKSTRSRKSTRSYRALNDEPGSTSRKRQSNAPSRSSTVSSRRRTVYITPRSENGSEWDVQKTGPDDKDHEVTVVSGSLMTILEQMNTTLEDGDEVVVVDEAAEIVVEESETGTRSQYYQEPTREGADTWDAYGQGGYGYGGGATAANAVNGHMLLDPTQSVTTQLSPPMQNQAQHNEQQQGYGTSNPSAFTSSTTTATTPATFIPTHVRQNSLQRLRAPSAPAAPESNIIPHMDPPNITAPTSAEVYTFVGTPGTSGNEHSPAPILRYDAPPRNVSMAKQSPLGSTTAATTTPAGMSIPAQMGTPGSPPMSHAPAPSPAAMFKMPRRIYARSSSLEASRSLGILKEENQRNSMSSSSTAPSRGDSMASGTEQPEQPNPAPATTSIPPTTTVAVATSIATNTPHKIVNTTTPNTPPPTPTWETSSPG